MKDKWFDHINLLKDYDLNDPSNSYILNKFKAWFEDHSDHVSWELFNEQYIYCERCDSWDTTQCICYAR